MPAPIVPWQPGNIPSEIQSELNRRKKNRSFNYINNAQAGWDKESGDWLKYKGPITSWIRVCSNSAGDLTKDAADRIPRFVLHGGKGFYQTYGFEQKSNGIGYQQTIGYSPDGKTPHIIENNIKTSDYPIHVPCPEISNLSVKVQKERFRRATVEWVCFSWKQLEYLTPYFLIPGLTILIEWGWNHFNPESLVKISDVGILTSYWEDPYPLYTNHILKSKGNYDVIFGLVSNFNWSVERGNRIICTTEITSKDRLYAGIIKDSTLTVRNRSPKVDKVGNITDSSEPGLVTSVQRFFKSSDSGQNFLALAREGSSYLPVENRGNKDVVVLRDIAQNVKEKFRSKNALTKDEIQWFYLKDSYLRGIFAGRTWPGKRGSKDFDFGLKSDIKRFWINMGLVVELLNYFSQRENTKDKVMFEVDITKTVISAHPNLISCNPNVLIPNAHAPKYHYGSVGIQSTEGTIEEKNDYLNQLPGEKTDGTRLADVKVRNVFYHGENKNGGCFRNNLSTPINWYRIKDFVKSDKTPPFTTGIFSFPSTSDETILGSVLEKDYSGLLSNIYISYESLKSIVLNSSIETYTEIYQKIFEVVNGASDNFWDLALVESDQGKIAIADRNYNSKSNLNSGETVYSFDYYDADSLIKTIKFTPQLSDAQATRAIYGSVNNKDGKYSNPDRNDLINFHSEDVILSKKAIDDTKTIEENNTKLDEKIDQARQQHREIIRGLQTVNEGTSKEESLQMTIYGDSPLMSVQLPNIKQNPNSFEIMKFVLPDSEMLRLMLDDGDEERNPRYCAIQPNINLELTLQGIGGLRTFQYFFVRNLPSPYSSNDVIFRITDVQHSVQQGSWETVITAGLLPSKAYIKKRLGINNIN